jgi:HlyD family secretion protein
MRSRSQPALRGFAWPSRLALGVTLALAGSNLANAQQPPAAKGAGEPAKQVEPQSLRARLRAQQLTTRKARAVHDIARLNREIAEIAVEMYSEGTYAGDVATIEGEIKLAESDLRRAEDRTEWARRMFEKGYVSMATKQSEELTLKKAQFTLEQAQAKKDVLIKYTRIKTIKELQKEVKKARLDELEKKAVWKREEAAEAELERQLDRD